LYGDKNLQVTHPVELDLPELVERLKHGGVLGPGELAVLKNKIVQADGADPELYYLARALALGTPPSAENIPLLERFLEQATDEWGLHGIIYALCIDWRLAKRYLTKLLELASPHSWETRQSAAIVAIGAIGIHLQSENDLATARDVLGKIENASEAVGRTSSASIREYRNALWRALDQWLRGSEAIVHPADYDADSMAIREVRARLRRMDS
jgi:hypothetical protein